MAFKRRLFAMCLVLIATVSISSDVGIDIESAAGMRPNCHAY